MSDGPVRPAAGRGTGGLSRDRRARADPGGKGATASGGVVCVTPHSAHRLPSSQRSNGRVSDSRLQSAYILKGMDVDLQQMLIDDGEHPADGHRAEVVHHQLREAIRTVAEPGSVMSQVQLAREFGVSGPLREALRNVQREGSWRGRRTARRVAPFSLADVRSSTRCGSSTRRWHPAHRAVDDGRGRRVLADSLRQMAHFANERDLDVWEGHHRASIAGWCVGRGRGRCGCLPSVGSFRALPAPVRVQGPARVEAGAAEHESIVAACAERERRWPPSASLGILRADRPERPYPRRAEHEPARIRGALRSVIDGEPTAKRRSRHDVAAVPRPATRRA